MGMYEFWRVSCFCLAYFPYFDDWTVNLPVAVTTMSLCDDILLCNFPKCRAKLSGFAWVTACSHVFCDQHGSGEFSRSPAICPACNSTLSGKLDIMRTELSPSEDYKAMVLAGLRPDIILDISARALAFWGYQVKHFSVSPQSYILVLDSNTLSKNVKTSQTGDPARHKSLCEPTFLTTSKLALSVFTDPSGAYVSGLQSITGWGTAEAAGEGVDSSESQ